MKNKLKKSKTKNGNGRDGQRTKKLKPMSKEKFDWRQFQED